MKQSKQISVSIGALAPPLHEQLAAQGVRLDPKKTEFIEAIRAHQKSMDALTWLYLRDAITHSERHRAGIRLLKHIIATLESAK